MNIGPWTYLVWLGCALPILGGQWILFHRRLAREAGPIFGAAGLTAMYLSSVDALAIRDGVWRFSPALTLGITVGPVPVEEILFFVLTSLLVTQSMALFRRV